MFDTDPVVRTDNRTLEKAPDILDMVGMNAAIDPLILCVLDGLMSSVSISDSLIGSQFIGIDSFCIRCSVLVNKVMETQTVCALHDFQPRRSTSLDSRSNHNLVAFIPMSNTLALPTDVGLIDFHNAIKRFGIGLRHGNPDSMAKIPCCLIGNSNSPFDLIRRDTLLGLNHQVDCGKPLPQWKMAIMENGIGSHGELIAA
jgi:hypothetical protein